MKKTEALPRISYFASLFILLFITNCLYSQYDWSAPLPLTDSLTNNTNPNIHRIFVNEEQKLYMAWEKSNDSLSTAIYIKDILNFSADIEVLAETSVHYTNPKIFPLNFYSGENDTLFFLFYESNFSGNQDIYYMAYTSQGSFSAPEEFFNTGGDDQEVDCNSNYDIVWTRNGDLVYSKLDPYTKSFIEPIVIDTNDCSSPKIDYNYNVLWQREDGNETHIYRAEWEGSNSWSDPFIVYDSGFVANLSDDPIQGNLYTWSAFSDSTWKLYTFSTGWNSYLIEYDIIQDEPFDPTTTPYVIGVKSTQDNCYCNISFPYEESGYKEIYLNPDPEVSFINLSNSGTDNRNPNMFLGETDKMSCFYVYDVWESFQNEQWQIYYSKIEMCLSGIEENESEVNFINVSPNPVSDKLNISYVLENRSYVKIDIADIYGKVIASIVSEQQNKGEQTILWTLPEIANGIYFILLRKDNEMFTQKIIKKN